MSQWQGMNSAAYSVQGVGFCFTCGSNPTHYASTTSMTNGNWGHHDCGEGRMYAYAWNTGYTGGTTNASYYNDCTACCAD